MTRVLDVLEAFLSLHGHAYLRLDGSTRVDQRQALVDRFNADARIFAFILSTRSGGVGLNLTGADSVVFYDSDWNPTMDAQAQDRCHRIGQTRDVHVFRLVTAATVEENILRKADQKRALAHLAVEGGRFTTSYLRAANIKELFESETSAGASVGAGVGAGAGGEAEGGELECALAAAEDEADAAAAAAARAEASQDLAEFDETLPLDDEPEPEPPPPLLPHARPKPPAEFAALMTQLSPIEKYAMRVVESSEEATSAESAALGEMRRQLHSWEAARRELRRSPSPSPSPPSPQPELTYCATRGQVWTSLAPPHARMPMWCPPTPPSGDGDVYCDTWARALYRSGAAAETLLPAVHRREPRVRGEPRRARPTARPSHAPPSLFERAAPRPRPRARPAPHAPHAHHHQPDWAPAEDALLRRALRLQRLPAEPPPARAPNWDWVAELVGDAQRAFRSPRACRDRHDALADPERARRRHRRPPAARRRLDEDAPRPPLHRLDAMRDAAERRRAAPKRRLDDPQHRNPKHAALLADHGVDYDSPPTPMEVATRRAERIAKEKQKASAGTSSTPGPSGGASAGPVPPPTRIVVAAKAEAARRARPAGEAGAQLLYRPHGLAPRQLKILQAAPAAPAAPAPPELRALQLQQLAVRRPARPHVLVAHLAPPTTRAPDTPRQ